MHEWRGRYYRIKNVPAEVCGQCGEVFLAPPTLKKIDRLVSKEPPDSEVTVAVYALKPRAA